MFKSIEVRGAEKSYGRGESKNKILNGLNMSVVRGSIYSLIGASGCGKTTLLSCILGMKKLDSGVINVLAQKVVYDKPSKVGHLIGYMPQNTDLTPELSIRETLFYFGNIFQINEKELNERYEMIKNLLELPFENHRIENLSGGQKRRVSLAAAIIHNPLILILDEPTVGLDALLREKIWNFIINTTRTSHLSVIITTHYISEAQQSDRCGMMRDGILLAEDTPQNIMNKYGAKTLDEAFLNVCLRECQNSDGLKITFTLKNENFSDDQEHDANAFRKRKRYCKSTITTLFKKEFICMKRQKVYTFASLFSLCVTMIISNYALGGNPIGLKLGVVNHDVNNCADVLQFNASYIDDDDNCIFTQASCHFINEIRDDDAIKVYYDSFTEAYEDAKDGKLIGVVEMKTNFTQSFRNRIIDFDENFISSSEISIYLDQSNLQITSFLQNRLHKAYERFSKELLGECDLNEKLTDHPLKFENTYESDFRGSILPLFYVKAIFYQAFAFSCYGAVKSRVDGIWNRTLLAGVQPIEILFAQFVFCFTIALISCINALLVTLVLLDLLILQIIWILAIIGLLVLIAGVFFGIFVSFMTENTNVFACIVFGGSFIAFLISGILWPIEGQPIYLRYFSYILSFALPGMSIKDVIFKQSGILQPSVYKGIFLCFTWVIASFILANIAIRKNKFSGN